MIPRTLTRQSNMELLRIMAMLMVLVIHATFLSLGSPKAIDMDYNPFSVLLRVSSQSFSLVCVNVFVLISGWFGIRFKVKGLASYLFQCFFLIALVFIAFMIFDSDGLSKVGSGIFFFNKRWFITSYLVLYCLSPILNVYIEHTPRNTQRKLLLLLLGIVIYFDNIGGTSLFNKGYSPLWLVVLYLLGNFVRTSSNKLFWASKKVDLLIYVSASLLTAFFSILFLQINNELKVELGLRILLSYVAPLTIVASVYLLLFFSKLTFTSRIINWFAASSFAVYLIHACTPFLLKYYKPTIVFFQTNMNLAQFIISTTLFIICVFMGCVLIDQIRIFVWKQLLKLAKCVHLFN